MSEELNLKYISTYINKDGTTKYRIQVHLSQSERHNLPTQDTVEEAIAVRDKFLMDVYGNLDKIKDYFRPKISSIEGAIRQYIEKGYPVASIAKRFDISEMTVRRIKNTHIDQDMMDKEIWDKLLYSSEYFAA